VEQISDYFGRPGQRWLSKTKATFSSPKGDFQKLVLQAVAKIPRGKVSTYRRIAAQIGKPRSARSARDSSLVIS
jgi:O6-methylguanine-DNA--protein-cysteine methyltransferase